LSGEDHPGSKAKDVEEVEMAVDQAEETDERNEVGAVSKHVEGNGIVGDIISQDSTDDDQAQDGSQSDDLKEVHTASQDPEDNDNQTSVHTPMTTIHPASRTRGALHYSATKNFEQLKAQNSDCFGDREDGGEGEEDEEDAYQSDDPDISEFCSG
jgi:hypothetical protein